MHIRYLRAILVTAALVLLASCRGGADSSSSHSPISAADQPTPAEASRLLAQSTFGATMAEIDKLTSIGYEAWFNDQFAKPQTLHRTYMDNIASALPSGTSLGQNQFFESFWQQAATAG
jgi:hypothetical protein